MVHHHHLKHQRKGDEEQQLLGHPQHYHRSKLHLFLFIFSLVCIVFLLFSLFSVLPFFSISSNSFQEVEEDLARHGDKHLLPCSNISNNTICCDRSTSSRTDVCVMKGDIRTHFGSSSIHLYSSTNTTSVAENIRPYTRKWETSVMNTIDELHLIPTATGNSSTHKCDVRHNVPAVVFSTGGYTGNVYHEFNDGILPLYITSQQFNKQVVFVILEYHDWWVTKYRDVLAQLSDFEPIDFYGDNRTHCFQEAIVGLRIHDELAIESSQMPSNKTILDFRRTLDKSYRSRIQLIEKEEEKQNPEADPTEPNGFKKPTLVIMSRNGSRGIDNEDELVSLCDEIGFDVRVLRPDKTMELAKIYRELNDSDVMIGVHGAAMTHLLFMRPKTTFVQVVPLGTDWAAEAYYGEPAKKMGLKYVEYKILPKESSLYRIYHKEDPVLKDPSSVAAKGWRVTKEVYLDGQSVRLDLNRFLKRITRVYQYAVTKKNRMDLKWDWSWQQPSQSQGQQISPAGVKRRM